MRLFLYLYLVREKEAVLHYLWRYKLLKSSSFKCVENKDVEILNWGEYNANSNGPDFKFSSIKYDGLIWFGNIEIHKNSSDWFKHKHHCDPQFENVILHVVRKHDETAVKFPFPTIVLENEMIYPDYLQISEPPKSSTILCNKLILPIHYSEKVDKNFFLKQRLDRKAKAILLNDLKRISISGFGKNTNSELFQFIADNWIDKESNLMEFISNNKITIDYLKVTKHAYSNTSLTKTILALESFLNSFPLNFFRLHENLGAYNMISVFRDSEWFKENSSIGYFLILNKWLPFFWGNSFLKWNEVLTILKSIQKENNSIVKQWEKRDIKLSNASDTQTILEIYSQLCLSKKCMLCPIGRELLK